MLRVLMTVDAVGGVWRYAVDLARSLAALDVKFHLVGFGPPPHARQLAECDALPNAELAWIDEPLDWTVTSPALLEAGAERLTVLAQRWNAELLHLNAPSQAAGLKCAQPIIAVSHSCVPTWWDAVRGTNPSGEWAWHHEWNRQGLDRAEIVVVPSESHRVAVARAYGGHRPYRVVHNAVPAIPAADAKQALVVSAGRWWDEGKNGAVLDKAAPASPWPIILAGPLTGPHGQEVRFDHVETTGSLSHDEVQRLLRRAAVFAAPSLYEPFGLAVAEAAMAGAALVLSDIPTFRELWHDAALFVPAREPDQWSSAFRRLAADDTLRQHLGAEARIRAAAFAPVRQAEGMWTVYQDARAASVT